MSVFDPVEQECLHRASLHEHSEYLTLAETTKWKSKIPNHAIFDELTDVAISQSPQESDLADNANSESIPSIAACAVHLELLEAFMVLRMTVIKSGWLDKFFTIGPSIGKKDPPLEKRRQKKWVPAAILAVVRFEAWWKHFGSILETDGNGTGETLTSETLPPLGEHRCSRQRGMGSLLIWYRCLNGLACVHAESQSLPRRLHPARQAGYLEDILPLEDSCTCSNRRSGPRFACSLTEPHVQHEAIDFSTRQDTLSPAAISSFETATGFPTDLLEHLKSLEPVSKPLLEQVDAHGHGACASLQAIEDLRTFWSLAKNSDAYSATIDLTNAVLRQGRFVDTMSHHLWIRAPSLAYTLSRGRSRYRDFFVLLGAYPANTMVPTIDIDLVWHTHQLNPPAYRAFSLEVAGGRFVNHIDTISNATRGNAFGVIRDLWQRHFGEEYSRCFCWDCELLLSYTEVDGEGEGFPRRGVIDERATKVRVAVRFYRAVEMARRSGGLYKAARKT